MSLSFIFRHLLIIVSAPGYSSLCAAEEEPPADGYRIERHLQIWQESPRAPDGWRVIDRKEGKITGQSDSDIFMLVTDGNNELLLWFHRHRDYWEATLLDSIKTENHRAYGVNPLDLRIHLTGNTVLYGREGSEAITGYEWDEQRHVFLPFTVSGN